MVISASGRSVLVGARVEAKRGRRVAVSACLLRKASWLLFEPPRKEAERHGRTIRRQLPHVASLGLGPRTGAARPSKRACRRLLPGRPRFRAVRQPLQNKTGLGIELWTE
jgi:hypothetical protein